MPGLLSVTKMQEEGIVGRWEWGGGPETSVVLREREAVQPQAWAVPDEGDVRLGGIKEMPDSKWNEVSGDRGTSVDCEWGESRCQTFEGQGCQLKLKQFLK